jgi:hypothetical protein
MALMATGIVLRSREEPCFRDGCAFLSVDRSLTAPALLLFTVFTLSLGPAQKLLARHPTTGGLFVPTIGAMVDR